MQWKKDLPERVVAAALLATIHATNVPTNTQQLMTASSRSTRDNCCMYVRPVVPNRLIETGHNAGLRWQRRRDAPLLTQASRRGQARQARGRLPSDLVGRHESRVATVGRADVRRPDENLRQRVDLSRVRRTMARVISKPKAPGIPNCWHISGKRGREGRQHRTAAPTPWPPTRPGS